MNKTKCVSYAYKTSPNAKRLGCYKTGCWVLKTDKKEFSTQTKEEIFHLAEKLDGEYLQFSFLPEGGWRA